jgi:membrane protease YdiL (CAAX protease family)
MLAASPIHTDRSTLHILQLGACFALVVFGPGLLLRHDGDVIEWRLWPRRFQWPDLFYVLISIPLAWFVLRVYFFVINPELPTHWPMPTVPDADSRWRLFLGINAVGIWDELFFVNVVFGVLRSLYRPPLANLAQAVVYTSVLYDMAFTGVGPLIIYGFALTQGAMYERERCLLYVLIVHLIVDAFLVAAILQYHYPGMGLHCF